MKKAFILLTLIVGLPFILVKKNTTPVSGQVLNQKLPVNIPFKEVKKTPEIVKVESVLPAARSKEVFLDKYQSLDLEELILEAKKLEGIQVRNRYFERANKGEMDPHLTVEITEFLREEAVVRHLILERKIEEFEREYL